MRCPSLGHAQQRGAGPATAEAPQTDGDAFAATQRAAKALAATDPEAAAALYSQLLRDWPKLTPAQVEQAYSAAALLRARAKDVTGALSLLDEGGKRLQNSTIGVDLRLLTTRSQILLGAGRAPEAQAVLEPQRQQLLQTYPKVPLVRAPTPSDAVPLLLSYLETLQAQGKWSEMAEAATDALWRVPGLLEDRSGGAASNADSENGGGGNGGGGKGKGKGKGKGGGAGQAGGKAAQAGAGDAFYDSLFLALQKSKRPDEALAWAKVRFEVCAFEKGAIDRAVESLRAAWIGNGEMGKPGQFNTFLREAGKDNPLAAIAPPTLETSAIEAYLTALTPPDLPADVLAGGPDAKTGQANKMFGTVWGRQTQRVSLLLLLRKYREAAQVAQGILQADPGAPLGSDQIARVLKARDGSLESGNRFYEYLKTGEGDNPLQGLLPG